MPSLQEIMKWTFFSECQVPAEIQSILADGEKAEIAYKTGKNAAVVTNKRLIIAETPVGMKAEIFTIPFKSIIMYSSTNAKLLDIHSEIELWTIVGKCTLKLNRGVDIRKLDRIIGQHIL